MTDEHPLKAMLDMVLNTVWAQVLEPTPETVERIRRYSEELL